MRKISKEEKTRFKELEINYKTCTCIHCGFNEGCRYAFDPYNTDGDCLDTK